MGLILRPAEVKSGVAQVRANIEGTRESYSGALSVVQAFSQNEALKSDSWDTAKSNIFEAHQVIVQGMLVAQDVIEFDMKKLEDCVENLDDLYEDDLIIKIMQLTKECENYEKMIITLQKYNNMFSMVSNGTITKLINFYRELLKKTKEELDILRDKLETLYKTMDQTSTLFSSVCVLLNAVNNAINDAEIYIDGNIKDLSNGEWKVIIPETIKEIQDIILEEAIVEELGISIREFEEKYGEKALADIKQYVREGESIKGLVDIQELKARIKCEAVEDVYEKQFGFDDKTTDILTDVYMKIYSKYDKEEVDWYFARSISQLGGYDKNEIFGVETYGWVKGAGQVFEVGMPDAFFSDALEISDEDYNYLRYMVRMEHFICGDNTLYDYNTVVGYYNNKEDDTTFSEWKEKMQEAYGREVSEEEYLEKYKLLCDSFENKGDFSHMLYTISANIIDEEHGASNDFQMTSAVNLDWSNKEERGDIAGWLGDAVYRGKIIGGETSFGNDDYISDLDADNIVHRMDNTKEDMLTIMLNYYNELDKGNADNVRTKEFLNNNKYENVEKKIFEKITVRDNQRDGKETMEDIKDNTTYKDTYIFLCKLQEVALQ